MNGAEEKNRGRILIVDDDASVRRSLDRLLRHAGYTVDLFASGAELLERRTASGPTCLVLDVHLPGLSGLELQQRLAGDLLPIIFITGDGDIPTSVRAMKSGAVDFLLKPFGPEALLEAIREAMARRRRADTRRKDATEIEQRFLQLTAREREVFLLVAAGQPNKQIATELGIVEQTVKVHRGRVMKKMQAESIAELVRFAGRLRLGEAVRE